MAFETIDLDHLEHIKREPFLAYPRSGLRRLVLWLGTAPVAWSAPQEPPAETGISMKPYVETIPGTDFKFEMVPIPGGTFTMGSPPEEAKLEKDDDPLSKVAPVRSTPFRSLRSGWASAKSPGMSTTSSRSRWT